MLSSWDVSPGTLILIGVQIIGFIVFLVRTDNKASIAKEAADEVQDEIKKTNLSVSALNSSLSLHREQVATNYVAREELREIKRELIDAINKLGDRVDKAMKNGH